MSTVHGLKISLWIPITVEKDDNVSRSQVNTQSTSAGSQKEQELLRALLVVVVDGLNTVLMGGRTVDTAIFVIAHD